MKKGAIPWQARLRATWYPTFVQVNKSKRGKSESDTWWSWNPIQKGCWYPHRWEIIEDRSPLLADAMEPTTSQQVSRTVFIWRGWERKPLVPPPSPPRFLKSSSTHLVNGIDTVKDPPSPKLIHKLLGGSVHLIAMTLITSRFLNINPYLDNGQYGSHVQSQSENDN